MFRYLIWDVDGTLFDTYPAMFEAFDAALDELGASVPSDRVSRLCRQSLSHCATTLATELVLDVDDILRRFQAHYAAIPARDQPPFPGVIKVCEYVRATDGQNFIVTHRGRQSLQRLLVAHEMTDYFTDCLTSDDGYPRKPDPASFEEMIQRYHLQREMVLAVGDREIDVLAGRAAGVRTCLFGPQASATVADYSITDYAELYCLLVAENDGESHLVR
jgi:HAD superfamily hydrolase (TIGR01509 family)